MTSSTSLGYQSSTPSPRRLASSFCLAQCPTIIQTRVFESSLCGVAQGIEFLMQHKYIGQTAEDTAAFLKTAKGLSLTKLGEYLGSLCVLSLRTSCNICTGTGLTAATSAPGLRSSCHIFTRTRLPLSGHICTGTGLTPARICTGTGLTPATSAPGRAARKAANACSRRTSSCSTLRTWPSMRPSGNQQRAADPCHTCNRQRTACDAQHAARATCTYAFADRFPAQILPLGVPHPWGGPNHRPHDDAIRRPVLGVQRNDQQR